jgi:voltage-gated potassium channel
MPRDVDKAALHATLDLLLRSLAKAPGAAATARPEAALGRGEPRRNAEPDALLAAYEGAKRSLRDMATRDPIDSVVTVVGVGTVLFYLAEKGKNEKVKNIWDALTFITTCLSVGFDDVFARTPAGNAIASFVMTIGPKLSASILDPPRSEVLRDTAEAAATQRAIVERLDAILEALRAGSAAGGTAAGPEKAPLPEPGRP